MILRKTLMQIAGIFLLVNLLCGLFFSTLEHAGIDPFVLMMGNVIVVFLTLISFYILQLGLTSTSTSGFMSSVLSSFMLKLMMAVLIIFLYSRLVHGSMNIPSIIISMLLYLIYMFIEMKGLLAISKKK